MCGVVQAADGAPEPAETVPIKDKTSEVGAKSAAVDGEKPKVRIPH